MHKLISNIYSLTLKKSLKSTSCPPTASTATNLLSSYNIRHCCRNQRRKSYLAPYYMFPRSIYTSYTDYVSIHHISHHQGSSYQFSTSTRKTRERAAPIVLTENAANRIKTLLEGKEDNIVGVRVSVRRRGCNGYSYTMNYATKDEVASTKDEIVYAYGVTVLVDPKAIFFLVGTVMDFEETELSSEFTFNNPNSKGECGCGESFNV